ncbi:MAG: hypothetical protein KC620_06675, partial [Myxococcales bacterium]|nr:hypothetical protein [Myxococcales bacterium]
CGDFGPVCEGDPMLRVCDGEGTQCLPSSALGQRNGGCDDSPCPHLEFPCPDSGVYTIWTAPNVDGEPYVCDLAVRTGPPQIERACENDGEEGLERTCGWHAAQIDGDCLPGFMYHVGCNPDGEGCNIGQACAGDPIMRVCPGDTPCLSASALAQNDDSCSNYCPSTTFECPLGGRFSVFTGSYRDGRDYTCEVTAERVQ